MSGRLRLNVFMNMLTTAVNALSGLVTLPLLIRRLGPDTYGLWTLIVAVAGYFLVLDLGVSSAVVRLVTVKRLRNEISGINAVLSTALVLMLGVCGLVMVASCIAAAAFLWFFHVPAAQIGDVRSALLLVGFTTAFSFPGSVLSGLLCAYERFDLENLVEIPAVLSRLALVVWLIGTDSTLFELAAILSGCSIAGLVARLGLSWHMEPRIRVGWRYLSRALAADVLVFGAWLSILKFARANVPHIATFIIGYTLGPAAVTAFTVPRLLVVYSNWLLISAASVVVPRAAVLHFDQQHAQQRDLFVVGGRHNLASGLFLVGGLILLGDPLLSVWLPGPHSQEYLLLVVLALGDLLPLSQWVTCNIIISMGMHRHLVILAAFEGLALLAVSSALVSGFGLLGVAVAVAAAGLVFRGLLQWSYGCRLVGISLLGYMKEVFVPVTLATLIPLAAFGAVRTWITPQTWFGVLSMGVTYSFFYWPLLSLHLLGRRKIAYLARSALRITARRVRSNSAAPDLAHNSPLSQHRSVRRCRSRPGEF
jgi:O-antigen/teichoic acid export membrane protein